MAARRQAHDESSYYQGGDGIYVNLFLPSKLTWTQNGSRSSLTQATQYPKLSVTELRFQLPRSENFTFHLRVPAWSDSKTRISVNGKLAEGEPTPGKFFAVSRTWKDGDRLDFEIGMPLRLEAVDAQNPDLAALMHGPLALFGTGDLPTRLTRAQLLATSPVASGSDDFVVLTDAGKVINTRSDANTSSARRSASRTRLPAISPSNHAKTALDSA